MQRVRRKDTRPELIVRKILTRAGFRYRLHSKLLAGTPDIVFPKAKKAIFVHGCFWHRHNCKRGTTPKANREFWLEKFAANQARDARNIVCLKAAGYASIVIWECETSEVEKLEKKLRRFLDAH